mmetsp:Transcript_19730/g.50087  ORF Transcript_19730/g.50087 Transcript_19730/m.50087 type:complete len:583 (-) Transcript_19730:260-2008(-)
MPQRSRETTVEQCRLARALRRRMVSPLRPAPTKHAASLLLPLHMKAHAVPRVVAQPAQIPDALHPLGLRVACRVLRAHNHVHVLAVARDGQVCAPQRPPPLPVVRLGRSVELCRLPRRTAVRRHVHAGHPLSTAAPGVSFDLHRSVACRDGSTILQIADCRLHRHFLDGSGGGPVHVAPIYAWGERLVVFALPVAGAFLIAQDDLGQPLDRASAHGARNQDAQGETVVQRQRLAVHLVHQQHVAVRVHRLAPRDRGAIGRGGIPVEPLKLHMLECGAVHIHTACPEDVAQAHARPGRIADGGHAPGQAAHVLRARHLCTPVATALQRRIDGDFLKCAEVVKGQRHGERRAVRCDVQAVVLGVNVRDREMVAGEEERVWRVQRVRQQLGWRLRVEGLQGAHVQGGVPFRLPCKRIVFVRGHMRLLGGQIAYEELLQDAPYIVVVVLLVQCPEGVNRPPRRKHNFVCPAWMHFNKFRDVIHAVFVGDPNASLWRGVLTDLFARVHWEIFAFRWFFAGYIPLEEQKRAGAETQGCEPRQKRRGGGGGGRLAATCAQGSDQGTERAGGPEGRRACSSAGKAGGISR